MTRAKKRRWQIPFVLANITKPILRLSSLKGEYSY